MVILYNDEPSRRSGETFHLVLLTNEWHVVTRRYLCRVSDAPEGRQVIAALQASWKITTPDIDKP